MKLSKKLPSNKGEYLPLIERQINARFVYCAIDEVLLIGSKRQTATGSAG